MNVEQIGALLAQVGAQLTEKVATWNLYHWAAAIFALGMALILGKAVFEELRYSKSLVGRVFIVCATAAVLLFAAAAYTEVAAANGWRWL